MTLHPQDLTPLIAAETALTGLYTSLTGKLVTGSTTPDDMRSAIEQRFAALEALREACESAPELLEYVASAWEGPQTEAELRETAHAIQSALHSIDHPTPETTTRELL